MIAAVFENEHFFIADKPAGVLTTPSRFAEEDGRRCLGTELQEQLGIQIYPVHRLDFEVSGLVVFAKNAEAHRVANAWFENKQVQKSYQALTTAQSFVHIPANIHNDRQPLSLVPGQNYVWESRQLRGKRRAYESPEGKPCLTRAHFQGTTPAGFLQWDLEPVTGRPHQLRFDLSRHGFSIVGDTLYGSSVEWQPDAIALRSYRIDFSRCKEMTKWGLLTKIEVIAL